MNQTGAGTEVRSVLKIRDLVAGYGGGDVLRGMSLDVAEGGITCVVGPNGAGKSTLMATISGLLRPRLGSVELDGQNLAGLSPRHLERLSRRALGKTPRDLYRELRLERGQTLLQQTGLSVLEIALACGFVSATHFSRCYRRWRGHSPSAERQTLSPPTMTAAH